MPDAHLYSGRYELVRHLARGGMAEVYLARDHLLDRPVALKQLFPEYARDEAFVERFRREAKAAANLNHPNIVAVYDWGEQGGTYFIVMEYVEGRSLRELLRLEGPLLPQRGAEIAADIAAALAFAHRQGVIHRDVKPGNVLITPQGQVKVTDFGIARAGADAGLTRTGMVMGTATYFSPEQAQGLEVDPRSDVYSLGVVLYEMVCGEPPFTGDDPVAIAYQHVREEPRPPGVANPDVPLDLERVILTALAKRPEDRYLSAEDMRADLTRFLRGVPVTAHPVTAIVTEVEDPTVVSSRTQVETRTATAVDEALPVPIPERRRRAFGVILAAVLLALGGLGFLLADQLGLLSGTESVVVPDLVDKPLEEARAELRDLGLEARVEFQENSDVPKNTVFDQDPEPGAKLEEGKAVTLIVSRGAGTARVPSVVDQPVDEARRAVEEAGFDVRTVEEASEVVEQGRVIRTQPPAGTELEKGSPVTLVVSSGRPAIAVPDVVDKKRDDARRILEEAGFEVSERQEPSSTVAAGEVIRTEPAAGTRAPRGSTVVMVVSSGSARTTVPNVFGLSEDRAAAEIERAGLFSRTIVTNACNPSDDGRVIAQDPAPGTEVDRGSRVTITVCEFLEPTTTSTAPGGP